MLKSVPDEVLLKEEVLLKSSIWEVIEWLNGAGNNLLQVVPYGSSPIFDTVHLQVGNSIKLLKLIAENDSAVGGQDEQEKENPD